MNDVFKNILARRSIRDFLPESVPDHVIRELIAAGTYAPSAVNKQPWRFLVIKNRELMDRLSDKELLGMRLCDLGLRICRNV